MQASSCWLSWLLLAAEKEEQDPAAVLALFESENDLQLIFADKRDIGDFTTRRVAWPRLQPASVLLASPEARWLLLRPVCDRLLRSLLPARRRVELGVRPLVRWTPWSACSPVPGWVRGGPASAEAAPRSLAGELCLL